MIRKRQMEELAGRKTEETNKSHAFWDNQPVPKMGTWLPSLRLGGGGVHVTYTHPIRAQMQRWSPMGRWMTTRPLRTFAKSHLRWFLASNGLSWM